MYNIAKIEFEMLRKPWTKSELALRAGVAISTVQRLFDVGSAHPDTIKACAKALGLTMDDLLEDETVFAQSGRSKGNRRKAS